MAANSKRELILAKVKTTLDGVSALSHVERKPFNGISELQAYPTTQLPVAVVLGGMPTPEEKFSDRTRKLDNSKSTLNIQILVYAQDNETPDTTVSTLADDIWAALYDDITLGYKWILQLNVVPDADIAFWEPYVAFSMRLNVLYLHQKGGL